MVRSMLILTFLPAALLLPSCGTGLTQIRDDIAVVAGKTKAAVEKAEAKLAAVETKVNEATEKFRAMGAPVDGTASDMVTWGAQNPGKVASGGFGAFALAMAGAWWRSRKKAAPVRKAFNAVVDTIEELPATATKAEILSRVAAHPQMDGEARAAVSIAKSR